MRFSELVSFKIMNDFEVKGIAIDSRKVKNGYVFFALKGSSADGSAFITKALESGAKAVISESQVNGENIYVVDDAQEILNVVAQKFYSPLPQNLIAITGTNGKTSTANFVAAMLEMTGERAASIGTLGTLLGGDYDRQFSYSGLTSPDIITLMEDLKGLKERETDYVSIEASSHGLQQKRFGDMAFKVGAFTNFTQDHLDYHKTMDEYFAAKMILFTDHIMNSGYAVVNADIAEYQQISDICKKQSLQVISYGRNSDYIKIKDVKAHDNGLDISINIQGYDDIIKTALIGSFQAYNVVCAIAILIALGFKNKEVCELASKLKPVKGRMDVIAAPKQKAKIVIDYAHTPDALEKALDSLRLHTSGKLICMFGCGGDRDKSKRPLMGKIAADKADVVIVTDDNPRTENAATIRGEIMAASPKASEIEGRREAIKQAVKMLKEGDSLLLAGKGHEDYQIIGKEKLPFDEFKIVNEMLQS